MKQVFTAHAFASSHIQQAAIAAEICGSKEASMLFMQVVAHVFASHDSWMW